MYRRAPGAGVISSRIFKCRRSTAMRKPISSCAHSRRICTESATWLDPGLSRAYSAICADCNDRITDCSSQSVIVSCRRPIAKRITGLSGHAAGSAPAGPSGRRSAFGGCPLSPNFRTLARPPASDCSCSPPASGGLAVWRSGCLCWSRRDGGSCCGRWRSGPASARSPSCSGRAIYHLIAREPSFFRGSPVGRCAAGIRVRAGGAQAGAGHGAVAEILRGGDHKPMPGPAVARRHPGAG